MKPAPVSRFEASIIVALYRSIRSVERVSDAVGRHRVTVCAVLRRHRALRPKGRPRQGHTKYPARRKNNT